MSHDNGVPESTICGWLKDEEKLCDSVDTVNSTDWMKRNKGQRCHNAKDPKLKSGLSRRVGPAPNYWP